MLDVANPHAFQKIQPSSPSPSPNHKFPFQHPEVRLAQVPTPPGSPTSKAFITKRPDYDDMRGDGLQPPLAKRMSYQPSVAGRRHGMKSPVAYLNEASPSSPQQQENVVIVRPEAPTRQHPSGNVKYKTSSGERLFTLDEVKAIVAGALKEQDVKMRAEYEKLFYQKLHEQQLSMTRYIDEIRGANSSGSDCSYIS